MKYKVYVKDLWEMLSRIALVVLFFLLGLKLGGLWRLLSCPLFPGTFFSFYLFQEGLRPDL